jgi:hypothetical protein
LRQISGLSYGLDWFSMDRTLFILKGFGFSRIDFLVLGLGAIGSFSSGSDCLPFDNTKIRNLSYVLYSIRSTAQYPRSMKKNNRLSTSNQVKLQGGPAFQQLVPLYISN